jgi:MFS family permease
MTASFEEKSVWIQLIGTGVSLAAYLWVAGVMYANGVDRLAAYAAVFGVAVVLMVIFLVIGHILAAVTGRAEKPDERDRVIGWRSESNSSWVLAAGVLVGIACMAASVDPVLVAHLLLLSLFAAQMLQYGLQILYYRRGM